jgi:hypothetical protein
MFLNEPAFDIAAGKMFPQSPAEHMQSVTDSISIYGTEFRNIRIPGYPFYPVRAVWLYYFLLLKHNRMKRRLFLPVFYYYTASMVEGGLEVIL